MGPIVTIRGPLPTTTLESIMSHFPSTSSDKFRRLEHGRGDGSAGQTTGRPKDSGRSDFRFKDENRERSPSDEIRQGRPEWTSGAVGFGGLPASTARMMTSAAIFRPRLFESSTRS